MRILNPTISGSLIVSGSTTIEGHIIPNTTETYDLGSPTNKWRDLYLSGSTIYLGDTKLTSGDSGSLEVKDVNDNILPIVAKSLHVGDGTNMIEIRRDSQKGTIKFLSSTMQETGELVSSDSIVVGTYSGSFTGSFIGDGSQLSGVTSYTDSDTLSYINSIGVVSGSVNWDTLIGKPANIVSSSSQLSNQTIPGDLTVRGVLTAQEFHTEFVSASIIYQSGSTQFGNSSDDVHTFIGTISATTIQNVISSSAQVDYNSIQNKPTIPTNNNQLTNGAGYCTTDTNTTYTANEMLTCIKTVDGAGSGLDADTLDGINSSGFMRTGRTFSTSPNIISNGGDRYNPQADNPTNNYYAILTYGNGSNVTGQLATHFQTGATYNRAFNSSWSAWTRMYDDNYHPISSDQRGSIFYIGQDTNDYIHVNTTVIDFRLDGNLDMRLENDGDLHVDGDVIAYSTTTSDIRFKDSINTIEDSLSKIKAIRGVEFVWNAGGRKGEYDLGVIAQEIEEVIPNIVREKKLPMFDTSDTLYKTVDYEKIIPLLIEGIKELTKSWEEDKNRIAKLEQILKNNGITE